MKLTTIPDPVPVEHPRCIVINRATREHAELLHAAASALNRAYAEFWKGTPTEIAEFFNELGVAQVISVGTAHNAQALVVNSAIEAALEDNPTLAARLPTRAIDVPAYIIDWGSPLPDGVTPTLRLVGSTFTVVVPE